MIPFLNAGAMLACFQSSGSRPKRINLLKSTHKEAASSCAHSLGILGCNPSGTGVLLTLKHCRAYVTSSWENCSVDTILSVQGEVGRLLGINVPVLKTEEKYVLNADA